MSGGQMGRADRLPRSERCCSARVAAQHSQCYAAWYSHIPGLKVVMPYTAADAKGLLKAAIRDPNPVIFLENEILYGQSFEVPKLDDFVLPIGKARIHRTGKDATLVSFGIGMTYAIKAAAELEAQGIDVEIIDLRTIRPMDLPTVIESVKKTGRLVTVEEGYPQSSVGTEIATRVMQQAFDYLDAPILTIAGKDVPMPYAANLEKLALPNVAGSRRCGESRLLQIRGVVRCQSTSPCRPSLRPWKKAIWPSGWSRKGDKVKSGDVIAEIETDKATMEVEAVDEGTVAKIVVPARH
jgi:pyruvate dehydrogenase E1 component beta subunit